MHANPSPATTASIEVQDLSFAYGNQQVLSDLRFSISKGSLGFITGKNGSGKTTLLKILSTLLRPTKGTALVLGLDIARQAEQIRAQVSAAFVNTRGLFSHLTVLENLQLHGRLYGMQEELIRSRIDGLNDLLLGKESLYPAELSMGMRQTVQIAKAFLRPAECYLLDEPFLSLDQSHRRSVEKHCERLAQQKCLLMTVQESELKNTALEGQVLCLA
jgi:ABC-type multidrug transport system ATPase subunit